MAVLAAFGTDHPPVSILAQVDPSIPLNLRGDPLRLGQVLTNLVNNAVKFTEQGEIRLSVHQQSAAEGMVELQFAVKDSGIGMTPEQCSRLCMRPWRRSSAATMQEWMRIAPSRSIRRCSTRRRRASGPLRLRPQSPHRRLRCRTCRRCRDWTPPPACAGSGGIADSTDGCCIGSPPSTSSARRRSPPWLLPATA